MAKSAGHRVRVSAKALDKVSPGWAAKVTKPINLRSLDLCVLGQVFGGFEIGTDAMKSAGTWFNGPSDGFFIDAAAVEFLEKMDEKALIARWNDAVKKRMKNAPKAAEQIAA
jgi:hypothetical protein